MADDIDQDVFDRVCKLLREDLCHDGPIEPQHSLTSDLGADSLDFVEIEMSLEEEFGIEIDRQPPAITFRSTVADLCAIVGAHAKG
jgi:acyl carrier protein